MLSAGTVPPDGVCKTDRLQLFIFQHIPRVSVLFKRLIAAGFWGTGSRGRGGGGAGKSLRARDELARGSGNGIQAALLFEGHFLLVIYFPGAEGCGAHGHTPARTTASVRSSARVRGRTHASGMQRCEMMRPRGSSGLRLSRYSSSVRGRSAALSGNSKRSRIFVSRPN